MIPIFRPWFDDAEVEAVREVLMSGWVGPGKKVEELEARFAHYVGAQHAVSLNSCSAALLLALKILDVEGGEVITTPLTFVSTNHAILQNGGTPVFCDIDPETLNIDPKAIAAAITPRTRAIMVVHFAGHPLRHGRDPIHSKPTRDSSHRRRRTRQRRTLQRSDDRRGGHRDVF